MSRWEPTTEHDIRLAIDEGALGESPALDMKQETGSTEGARKETARDLASFALDGGALLIGVAEQRDPRGWLRTPQPLMGMVEKIELVARQRVDPPLSVRTREIPSEEDDAVGYLWVDVPPSPDAPHMVDGVYYGRGERNRRRLTDAEVVRLHERRRSRESVVLEHLADEEQRDHAGAGHPQRAMGHLHVAAVPLTAQPDLAVRLLSGQHSDHMQAALATDRGIPQRIRGHAPGSGYLSFTRRVTDGVAIGSYSASGEGRTLRREERFAGDDEANLVDITLRDDGGVRLTLGRGSWQREERGAETLLISDGLIYAWTLRVFGMAAYVARQTGYRGSWGVGVRADRLRGGISAVIRGAKTFGEGGTVFDREEYQRVTTAMTPELDESPRQVADRLLTPLLRALGAEAHFDAMWNAQ